MLEKLCRSQFCSLYLKYSEVALPVVGLPAMITLERESAFKAGRIW